MHWFIVQMAIIGSFCFGMRIPLRADVSPKLGIADTNLPNAVLSSPSQVRSLALLLQVVKQLEVYVRTKDLSSIHNEDAILSAAANELLTQPTGFASVELKSDFMTFCQKVGALHLAADLSQQARSEEELGNVMESFDKVRAHFPSDSISEASRSLEVFTCPRHRDVVGKRGDFCPKCGTELDQICRILPANSGFPMPGQQSIRASASAAGPLMVGQPAEVLLRLWKANGDPLLSSDLIETHTKRVHLLVIDNSLTDYHHEHPQMTRTPGELSFTFTPRKPGGYRIWADLRPYPLGLQEYVMIDIPGSTTGESLTDRAVNLKANLDGLNYELVLTQKPILAGRPVSVRLRITTAEGKDFTQLEPLMGAYAHLVGFREDNKTVLHMHPKGPPIMELAARGGPELEFLVYALRPGFVRLFAQVQIEGRSRFVPFGLQIAP